ncbi:hypothetical protein PENTCL1PPCAC_27518, partial [Pristionchus entomophagus]
EQYETSNKLLTNQLDWYKKGWLTYHEYARNEINQSAQCGNKLPPSSFPMPPQPSYNPLAMSPVTMPPSPFMPPQSPQLMPPPPPPLLLALPAPHPDPILLSLSNPIVPILPESTGLKCSIRK